MRYESTTDQLTDTPGVYLRQSRRGSYYRVVYRPEGDRRVIERFETYEEARAFKLNLPNRSVERRENARWKASPTTAYLLADGCSYCSQPADTLDHIVPRINGGGDDWSNLTGACRSCNSAKKDRDLLGFLLARLDESDGIDVDLFALLAV